MNKSQTDEQKRNCSLKLYIVRLRESIFKVNLKA